MSPTEVNGGKDEQDPPTPARKEGSGEGIVGGLVLIILGLLFLGDHLIPGFHFGDYWPLILVAIGVGILWKGYRERS